MSAKLTLVVADQNGGKSTTLKAMLEKPPYSLLPLCGFLSLANPEKTVYRLMSVRTREVRTALALELPNAEVRLGRFLVDQQVFAWANEQIISDLATAKVAVFDEIGRLELGGGGFSPSFKKALQDSKVAVVAAVRLPFVDEVLETFAVGIRDVELLYVGKQKGTKHQ